MELAKMTFRRFLLLLSMLPGDSATAAFHKDRMAYFLAEVT